MSTKELDELDALCRLDLPRILAETRRLRELIEERDDLASELADALLRIEVLEGRE